MQAAYRILRRVSPGPWQAAAGLILCLGMGLAAEKTGAVVAATKPATLDLIQVQKAEGVTRVIVTVSGLIDIKCDRIENPPRVFIDFLNATPMLPGRAEGAGRRAMQTIAVGDRLLKQIRVAENQKTVARIVLDLAVDEVSYSTQELKNPSRLVVELRPATRQPGEMRNPLREAPPAVSATRPPAPVVLSAVKLPEPPRVVDPLAGPGKEKTRRVVTAQSLLAAKPKTPVREATWSLLPPPVLAAPLKLPKADLRQTPYQNSGILLRDPRLRPPPATPVAKQAALANSPGVAATRTSAGRQSLTRVLGLKIGKVVIDPGHGGHDPGSIGPTGLMEKELVLDIANRLGELIEERLGSEVIYTRTDDTFVPLEQRPAIANQAKADLFISIHANSSRINTATGVETYYLNFTSSPEALEVAARENASSERSVGDLTELIKKIALKDKLDESREFAGKVQGSLMAGTMKAGNRTKDRGVRKAPLVVLIGAGMPSVLAEIGFLSNPKEEALLKKPEYRQKLAESLFRGVSQYADTLSHFTVARSSLEDEN